MDKVISNIEYLFRLEDYSFDDLGSYYEVVVNKPYFEYFEYINTYAYLEDKSEFHGDGLLIKLNDFVDNDYPVIANVVVIPNPSDKESTIIRVVIERV